MYKGYDKCPSCNRKRGVDKLTCKCGYQFKKKTPKQFSGHKDEADLIDTFAFAEEGFRWGNN